MMKATIVKPALNGKNYAPKLLIATINCVAMTERGLREIVTVRCYMAQGGSVVYCSLWIHTDTLHCAGHGQAGGGGYHKASAAFDVAICSAGIQLDESINAAGDSAMDDAVRAIASALGYDDIYLVRN